jgi:hypothetical protein
MYVSYPEPDKFSSHPKIYFFTVHDNIIPSRIFLSFPSTPFLSVVYAKFQHACLMFLACYMCSQSASLSVKSHLGPKTRFFYYQTFACLLVWGALSLTVPSGARQHGHSRVRVSQGPSHILLSHIRDSSNLKGLGSPYLYLLGTGWPRHTPRHWDLYSLPPTTRRAKVEVPDCASTHGLLAKLPRRLSLYSYIVRTDRIGNTAASNSSVIACVSVAVSTCLPSCRLATAFSCGSII